MEGQERSKKRKEPMGAFKIREWHIKFQTVGAFIILTQHGGHIGLAGELLELLLIFWQ